MVWFVTFCGGFGWFVMFSASLWQTMKIQMKCQSGSVLFVKIKTIFCDTSCVIYRKFDRLSFIVQNGQFHTNCVKMYGIIYQNDKR